MSKLIEFKLNFWEITYWPERSSKAKYCARITWTRKSSEHTTIRDQQEKDFKTFEEAKAWIDLEVGHE